MEIFWLDQSECQDTNLEGGKAAQLSRLTAYYRIPPGFCLTTSAFTQWTPNNSAFPQPLYVQLETTYNTLAERCEISQPSVAVRSSAIDEDGQAASFAGLYETYLNISGLEEVAEAITRCWDSVYSDRVVTYRRQQGLALHSVKLAVLVQQLVAADVSTVVFSANPINGSHDEVVINANWALGESIVGGAVTPDTYIVRKSDLIVTTREIANKQRMIILKPNGTREVTGPRLMSTQPSLSDDQAVEMARLALTLEKHMGWPVDIECAYLSNWEAYDLENASMPALLDHLTESFDRYEQAWQVHFRLAFPMLLPISLFEEMYRDIFEGSSAFDAYSLLEGFDNKTLEGGRALWNLSRQALDAPQLRQILEGNEASRVLATLEKSAAGQAILSDFNAFLQEYGQRGDKWETRQRVLVFGGYHCPSGRRRTASWGLLVQTLGWQSTFYVNIIFVVPDLILGWRVISARPPRVSDRSAPFDLAGALLLSLVLISLAWLLTQSRRGEVQVGLLPGSLILIANATFFVWREFHHPDPVLQPRFFAIRAFAAATGAVSLSNLAMYSTLFTIPILLSNQPGWTDLQNGLVLTAMSAAMVLFAPLGGRLADFLGRRWPTVAGLAILTLGLLYLRLTWGYSPEGTTASTLPALLGGLGLKRKQLLKCTPFRRSLVYHNRRTATS